MVGTCGTTPLACDDSDPCTVDSCDPVTGCSNVLDESIPGCEAPTCAPVDAACDSDADCCSGKCRGRPGASSCR